MKIKPITNKFRIPLFDADFTVIVCENPRNEIEKLCASSSWDVISSDTHGFVTNIGDQFVIVLKRNKLSHNLIAHECHHATHMMFSQFLKHDEYCEKYNGEQGAFVCAYISEQIYKVIRRAGIII